MSWFKHNGNASFDSRIIALQEALGYFGIGIYWSMVERIECWGEGFYPRKRLIEEMASRKADRHKLQMVLDDFDLFLTLDSGMVVLQNSQPTPQPPSQPPLQPTPSPEDENEAEPAGGSAPQRTRVSSLDRKKDNNNNNNNTTTLDAYADQLKAEQSEWREMVCMKSGYSHLLNSHWTEAVEQWRQHVICYDTANQIGDYQRARYYFNSFIKLGTKSGEALKATLEALEARASLVVEEEPLPLNAPPRPSPNALWNPAKEEWCHYFQ